MSDVTNIKTISNQLLFPVTVRNGENNQQTFTVPASGGWNGDMWIPWVVNSGDMWKSIHLEWPDKYFYIFQHGGYIYYSWDNDFNHKDIIGGNNTIRGEKAVIIASNTSIYLS